VDGDDGVFLVLFGAQQEPELPILESALQVGQFRGHLLQGPVVILLQGQVQEHLQVFHPAGLLLPLLHRLQQGAPLPEDVRGPGLVLPELRDRGQFFDMPEPDLLAPQIKDDLGGVPDAP
jgi:hypothetical protein